MAVREYTKHRESQREQILEAAQDLFISKGVMEVTVANITEAVRITRPTFYKYFSSKEDTALEMFKAVTRGWAERGMREVWNKEGSGYEIIELFMSSHFQHVISNPREARFVAEFNYLYAKKFSVEKVTEILKENLGEEELLLLKTIKRGQADGSIRNDMDPETLRSAIFNFVSGLNSRLGELGAKLEGEYHIGIGQLFNQVCTVFLDGLKSHDGR